MSEAGDTAWRANLAALGQWQDALLTKDPKIIAAAQARMDETADAYLATRRKR